ncbi:hypothetical protein C4573_06140 [Candidatus Woesearchaeota archaeon]|nr:MAG: hypothetical protein C4573_06140 [Candidatus Woesearchaeota archaeon]
MIDLILLFSVVGVVIFLGFAGEIVFRKTSIPDIIWLILFGIVIGSFYDVQGASIITDIAPVFTTFALIFILFEGALSINISDLFKSMSKTTVITLLSFVLAIAVVTGIFSAVGLPVLYGMLIGAILGGTTSAVVIPLSERLAIKSETVSILKLESALNDVLCVLASITFIGIIVNIASFSLSKALNQLLGSFAIAILIGVVVALLWIPLLKFIQKHVKSYLITIALMLILYAFVEYIHANGAIACLAFGLVLGNSKKIYELMRKDDTTAALSGTERFFYSQISFFVKAFFFVYIGMLMDFSNPLPFIIGGVITIALFLIRPVAIAPYARKLELKDKAVLETLIPKGLAAAVLAQLPSQMGIEIFQGFESMIMAVVLYTILLSSLFVFLIEKNWFFGFTELFRKLRGLPPLAKPAEVMVQKADEEKKAEAREETKKQQKKK